MGLDSVELLLSIEEEFDIDVSNEEASRILTVGDLETLVLSKVGGRAYSEPEHIWQQLVGLVADASGVRVDEVRRDAHIVRDLGVN